MAIREAGSTVQSAKKKKIQEPEKTANSKLSDENSKKLPKPKKTASNVQSQNKFRTIVQLLLQNNPTITEERNSKTKPLDLLILLILNQSTTDELSDRAFAQLKKDYPDYKLILKENNAPKLTQSIKICGLAPTKAQYILNTLHFLAERGWFDINMKFIRNMSDEEAIKTLTQIKGVGVKSVSCLLMFAFGRGTFPIDTHLFRIFRRIGGIIPEKASSEQAHKIIQPQVSGQEAFIVHVSLITIGRTICLAPQKPLCHKCCLSSFCEFHAICP